MASLSHQSAVNLDRAYWLAAEPGISTASQFVQTAGGSVMEYNGDIRFATDPAGISTARILGVAGGLFIQSANQPITFSQFGDGVARTQINPDSTWQNGFAGIYTSTLAVVQDKVELLGYNTTGHQLTMNQRDANNNLLQSLDFYLPRGTSTMSVLSYQSKDSMSFNSITSPIFGINPYATPSPTLQVPTYTLSTSQIQTSTINGIQSAYQFVSGGTINFPNNSPQIVQQFPLINQSNYIFEGKVSAVVNWTGTPAATDEITLQLSGGSAQNVDNLTMSVFPATIPAGSNAYLSISGVFQTSATATDIDLVVDANAGTPLDYSIQILNGYITPLKHQ